MEIDDIARNLAIRATPVIDSTEESTSVVGQRALHFFAVNARVQNPQALSRKDGSILLGTSWRQSQRRVGMLASY
jgi:hypothetical protein